ncbi:MAG: type II secretion system protein GspG [Verrucomicrobia bacterium]|nr:MAG: type II secretion system protein GspG [Verrucomicrobiota bacterium]
MHRVRYRRPAKSGLILLAVVCGIFVPIYWFGDAQEHSQHVRVTADIQKLNTQLALYKSMNGFFPTTDQGLQALVVQPDTDPRPMRWHQLYKKLAKDPWDNDYIYREPGFKNPNGYDLFTAGPDRKPGTADDDWGD